MAEKPSKPSDKPKQPTEPKPEGWRPRMVTQRTLHAYSNLNQEPDPLTESPNITDPSEDTAPLQGSLDRSDDDSVVPEYSGSEAAGEDEGEDRAAGDDRTASDDNAGRTDTSGPDAPSARNPGRGRKRGA